MLAATGKGRPAPSPCRLLVAKGSRTRAPTEAGTPLPVSRTDTATVPGARRTTMRAGASGSACAAAQDGHGVDRVGGGGQAAMRIAALRGAIAGRAAVAERRTASAMGTDQYAKAVRP
jgi:hypothetical protein